MEAGSDRNWLSGDPAWWGGEVPPSIAGEVPVPESWVGWHRQRMKPNASRFVYGPSWSAALLVASLFPLVFPGNTPDDQVVALALFMLGFIFLLASFASIVSQVPYGEALTGLRHLMFGADSSNRLKLVLLLGGGASFFVSHIVIDVRLGWISVLFLFSWWAHLLLRSIDLLTPLPGRLVAPISEVSNPLDDVAEDWEIVSPRFKEGLLAMCVVDTNRSLELVGLVRAGQRFVGIQVRHVSSLVYAPLIDEGWLTSSNWFGLGGCGPRSEGLSSHLGMPPLNIDSSALPEVMMSSEEE